MADTLTVDDDEWDADDIRNMKRTADQMTIWKRDGDKRIAELEAALRRITPAYRAACAQIKGQSGDAEYWDDDKQILEQCEKLIGKSQ